MSLSFDGALLRRIRIALDVSAADLGRAAGITAERIDRFEDGREMPGPDVIRALAAHLRISPYCFYDPDVTVTRDEIEVRRRPGESTEEYIARSLDASPPLGDDAKAAIRSAADDYWMNTRRRKR